MAGPSGYCLFHDPARGAERQAARSKGGKALIRRREHVKVVSIGSMRALADSLSEVYAEVRSGQLTHREGQALASIGSVILATLKALKDSPEREETWRKDKFEALNHMRELYGLPPMPRPSDGGNGQSAEDDGNEPPDEGGVPTPRGGNGVGLA